MRLLILIGIVFYANASLAQEASCACCSDDHRAFDFWLGQWEVTNPNGTFAGSNSIVKVENGCVLREQWTSATPGYTGTSMNYYDLVLKQWVQLWVDNQGQSLYMRGGIVDGSMVLLSDRSPDGTGGYIYNRVSWTPKEGGKVRQHWQTSPDKQEWTTAFDGVYSPKN